jgi:hypothetical protein
MEAEIDSRLHGKVAPFGQESTGGQAILSQILIVGRLGWKQSDAQDPFSTGMPVSEAPVLSFRRAGACSQSMLSRGRPTGQPLSSRDVEMLSEDLSYPRMRRTA